MNEFVFPRYIKREDAQKVLCGWCGVCQNPTLEDLEKCDDICPQFAQIPDADVRPVAKAYWIGEGDGYAGGEMVYDVWSCSNCGYTVDEGDNEPPRYNFCPNCGADMRGGDGNG